jgi:hypothetical protein
MAVTKETDDETSWPPHTRLRDTVLTYAGTAVSKMKRVLWFSEAIVLSARYQQLLKTAPWATGSNRRRDRIELWERSAKPLLSDGGAVVLEFGVADGHATAWWAAAGISFAEWHGFDTFEGLPEAWRRGGVDIMAAGVFTPSHGLGETPKVSAPYPIEWHKGLIHDTLSGFSRPDAPLFVLVDVDLYEPTADILEWLGENGRPGDAIYFDESFDPWNEGLAIREAVDRGLRIEAVAHTGNSLLVVLIS